MATEDILVK